MAEETAERYYGRRAARYWFIDGLPELSFGIALFVWGAFGLVWGNDPKNPWKRSAWIAAILAYSVLLLWAPRILEFFKARLTYPRTGYARPPVDFRLKKPDPFVFPPQPVTIDENFTSFRMRTVYLFSFGWLMVLGVNLLSENSELTRWAVPVVAGGVAFFEYWCSRGEARSYSKASVVPIAAAALLSVVWDLPRRSRPNILPLIGGAWLLGHGAWALATYLRTHPRKPQLDEAS